MILPDKVYDTCKWVVMIVLPATGTLYFALCGIWNFPYGEQVIGTITAVCTFLGAVLKISNANYNKQDAKSANYSKQDVKNE